MKRIIGTIIGFLLAFFSYDWCMAAIYLFLLPLLPASLLEDPGLCETAACSILILVYVVWLWRLNRRQEAYFLPREEPLQNGRKWKTGLCITVIALGMGGVSNVWLELVDRILYRVSFVGDSYQVMQSAFEEMTEGSPLFAFLSIVVVGPIVEELLFRGILYGYLECLFRNPLIPILTTGILFGIWHGILVQSVYTTACGLVMAIVFCQTRDLRYPIAIHIINNLLSFLPSLPYMENAGVVIDTAGYLSIIPMIVLLGSNHRRRCLY